MRKDSIAEKTITLLDHILYFCSQNEWIDIIKHLLLLDESFIISCDDWPVFRYEPPARFLTGHLIPEIIKKHVSHEKRFKAPEFILRELCARFFTLHSWLNIEQYIKITQPLLSIHPIIFTEEITLQKTRNIYSVLNCMIASADQVYLTLSFMDSLTEIHIG
jgi:hypothetical protein